MNLKTLHGPFLVLTSLLDVEDSLYPQATLNPTIATPVSQASIPNTPSSTNNSNNVEPVTPGVKPVPTPLIVSPASKIHS